MHQTFRRRIDTKTATPFCLAVWHVVSYLEQQAKSVCPTFISPLRKSKLVSWEDHAYKHRLQADTASSINVFRLLGVWYMAIRLLVQSWEEHEVLVLQWLQLNDALTSAVQPGGADIRAIQKACQAPYSFYKLGRLRFHLIKSVKSWVTAFVVSFLYKRGSLRIYSPAIYSRMSNFSATALALGS
jgi:hypothetical protein